MRTDFSCVSGSQNLSHSGRASVFENSILLYGEETSKLLNSSIWFREVNYGWFALTLLATLVDYWILLLLEFLEIRPPALLASLLSRQDCLNSCFH